MENPRPEKVAVVEEVRQRLDSADAAILTEYRGLKVSDLATLRRSIGDAGGEYRIYKNTLVRFAARDLGLEELVGMLEGPTAIAFVSGDAAAVAKALRDYSRTNPTLVVKGGVLGSRVMSAADTTALAELPTRDVLLARLAGGLQAPLAKFAGLLQALPRNFAYGLKALIDQGGAPGAPAAPAAPAEAPAETASIEVTEDAAGEPAVDLPESPAPDGFAVPPGGTDSPADGETTDLAESPASDGLAQPPADASDTTPTDTPAQEEQ